MIKRSHEKVIVSVVEGIVTTYTMQIVVEIFDYNVWACIAKREKNIVQNLAATWKSF